MTKRKLHTHTKKKWTGTQLDMMQLLSTPTVFLFKLDPWTLDCSIFAGLFDIFGCHLSEKKNQAGGNWHYSCLLGVFQAYLLLELFLPLFHLLQCHSWELLANMRSAVLWGLSMSHRQGHFLSLYCVSPHCISVNWAIRIGMLSWSWLQVLWAKPKKCRPQWCASAKQISSACTTLWILGPKNHRKQMKRSSFTKRFIVNLFFHSSTFGCKFKQKWFIPIQKYHTNFFFFVSFSFFFCYVSSH